MDAIFIKLIYRYLTNLLNDEAKATQIILDNSNKLDDLAYSIGKHSLSPPLSR